MVIPTQFLPIHTNKPKPAARKAVALEKAESNPNSAKPAANAHVIMYEKREGEDRRKRRIKPLLDTRSGHDRRKDKARQRIDITA